LGPNQWWDCSCFEVLPACTALNCQGTDSGPAANGRAQHGHGWTGPGRDCDAIAMQAGRGEKDGAWKRKSSAAAGHHCRRWAEAPIKIARMTLTIKLDGNWSSFQLANSAPPLSVTGSATAPSARMTDFRQLGLCRPGLCKGVILQTACKPRPCASLLSPWQVRPMLAEARKLTAPEEILLWMTPSEAPKALQASECSELLDPTRASCWIFAQH